MSFLAKKMMSIFISFSLLLNVSYAQQAAVQHSPLHAASELQKLVNAFKHEIYVEKKDAQQSLEHLATQIIDKNFSISDLQLFVQLNATKKESEKFNEVLSLAVEDVQGMKDLNAKDLSFLLQNAITSTNATGAHFMSCSMGLGIGIPLLAVGVIVGIIAIVNASASKELITQDYINKRSTATNDYLYTKADLELELTTYNSDIVYYQDQIAELNRKISTGLYSASEVEQMKIDIRDYEFFISDKVALIGEVNVDIRYFESKYESDMAKLNSEEVSSRLRVDEKVKSSKSQAIVAGISTALGSAFLFTGMKDCN
jgi:hypothetical protein